ncbi:FAD binding domain-containing protein [Actinacidiphila guanduensis]|uniref:Carbon-monoxide dehydrogenase medium subunit n=1 Tax=Actinacidiphila guanduensis TaxID=310781 RepID=A0A1H0QS72_9ACTN|nr:FAD binding domain-containing protein [Actinacidiphila guanduensis]SDP19566.1 carbon-monoxide dehydrogenase medium subunit [Actinacidiphila guanduensis]
MTTLDRAPEHTGPVQPPVLLAPDSLDEALRLLAAPEAAAVAGGVRHTLRRHDRLPTPATLVSVGRLPGFGTVTWSGDEVVIGAGARLADLEADARLAAVWPAVTEAAGSVATARIRRMVTLGGNLAARDDSHDPPVALAAAGARLTVRSACSTRTLAVGDLGGLRGDELIQEVRLPLTAAGAVGSSFVKFLVRGLWEYACVNVAAVVRLDADGAARELSLAVGSVTGGPVLIDLADLVHAAGRDPGGPGGVGDAVIEEAARRAADRTRPYSDVRGSAAYKTRMIAEFARRALTTAALRAAEGAAR